MFYARTCSKVSWSLDEKTQMYKVTGPCKVTGQIQSVSFSAEGYEKYRNGALIQNAFPELSPDEREFLISGTSKEGWEKLFGSEEE